MVTYALDRYSRISIDNNHRFTEETRSTGCRRRRCHSFVHDNIQHVGATSLRHLLSQPVSPAFLVVAFQAVVRLTVDNVSMNVERRFVAYATLLLMIIGVRLRFRFEEGVGWKRDVKDLFEVQNEIGMRLAPVSPIELESFVERSNQHRWTVKVDRWKGAQIEWIDLDVNVRIRLWLTLVEPGLRRECVR